MPTPEIVPNWNIGVYYVKQDGVTLGGFHEKKYAELFLRALENQRIESNNERKV
jgi:hypothetical protein